MVAAADAQKAGRLLEGFLAEAGNLLELLAVAEPSVGVAIGDETGGEIRVQAGDPCQQRRRAVLTSTPMALTQSSTTASKVRASCVWLASCWYWPTPIDCGSIFTSSARGSCKRRAMETAPRSDTSRSGSSLAAYAEAE